MEHSDKSYLIDNNEERKTCPDCGSRMRPYMAVSLLNANKYIWKCPICGAAHEWREIIVGPVVYISVAEAAAKYNVSPDWLATLIAQNRIDHMDGQVDEDELNLIINGDILL